MNRADLVERLKQIGAKPEVKDDGSVDIYVPGPKFSEPDSPNQALVLKVA